VVSTRAQFWMIICKYIPKKVGVQIRQYLRLTHFLKQNSLILVVIPVLTTGITRELNKQLLIYIKALNWDQWHTYKPVKTKTKWIQYHKHGQETYTIFTAWFI